MFKWFLRVLLRRYSLTAIDARSFDASNEKVVRAQEAALKLRTLVSCSGSLNERRWRTPKIVRKIDSLTAIIEENLIPDVFDDWI